MVEYQRFGPCPEGIGKTIEMFYSMESWDQISF
jgi:hypothetical protein